MVHYLIHEIAVVAHHDDTSLEVLQILFQHLQRHDIQVVRRLVEYQEVRIPHQYRTQVQPSPFSSAQLIYVAVLGFRSKQKMLQELRSRQALAIAKFDNLRNVRNHVDDLHLLVKLQSLLRIISEPDRLTDIQGTLIRFLQSHQNLDERRFTRSVVSHDTHLFVAREDVREILQNLQVAKTLVQMVRFENLGTDICRLHVQLHLMVVHPLLRHLLQVVKRLFPVARLMPSGLRHPPHPFQFRTIQVVGTRNLRIRRRSCRFSR